MNNLSVCPRAYLWNSWTDRHEILFGDPLWLWLGPPPAALRYVMYFRFIDDVTFGRNGPYVQGLRLMKYSARRGVARPGRSLMSMNALFL